jgi:hypothetical protein
MEQLDLFRWADSCPPNVIDAMPALIRKAAMETIYQIPQPKPGGKVVFLDRTAA